MRHVLATVAGVVALVALSLPAAAQTPQLSGEEIAARIGGRTFTGQTPQGDVYVETVHGRRRDRGAMERLGPLRRLVVGRGRHDVLRLPPARPRPAGCSFVTLEDGVASYRDGQGQLVSTMRLAR